MISPTTRRNSSTVWQAKIATVPADSDPEVYYARGPQGLTTGMKGSINVEMIEFLGAANVAARQTGGLTNVGLEQVVLWIRRDLYQRSELLP